MFSPLSYMKYAYYFSLEASRHSTVRSNHTPASKTMPAPMVDALLDGPAGLPIRKLWPGPYSWTSLIP